MNNFEGALGDDKESVQEEEPEQGQDDVMDDATDKSDESESEPCSNAEGCTQKRQRKKKETKTTHHPMMNGMSVLSRWTCCILRRFQRIAM